MFSVVPFIILSLWIINTVESQVPVVYGMQVTAEDAEFSAGSDGILVVPFDVPLEFTLFGSNLNLVTHLRLTCSDKCQTGMVISSFENSSHIIKVSIENLVDKAGKWCKFCLVQNVHPLRGRTVLLTNVDTYIIVKTNGYSLPMWLKTIIIIICLMFSALFSGLALGLMTLSEQELELLIKCGSEKEKQYATKILPLRKKGYLLICSIALCNTCVNSIISLLTDNILSGTSALVISTLVIVIFGEILPQAICVKKGLAVGAHTIGITKCLIVFTGVISWPLSKFLACVLGVGYQTVDRKRLMELLRMSLDKTNRPEMQIAEGALMIAEKVVQSIMTKIEDVFMLADTSILNAKTVSEIVQMGYTRIPIYSGNDRNNVTNILIVKDLVLLDPDDNFPVTKVCEYHKHPVRFVKGNMPLNTALEIFKKGDCHLAMVQKVYSNTEKRPDPIELIGVVTLEDIVEEILQAEIKDEFDLGRPRKTTQVKDMTRWLRDEPATATVPLQIQIVALQWLVANMEAFKAEMISKSVLERLIKMNCKKIELSAILTMPQDKIPPAARLYVKDKISDRFTIILEGRVFVSVGQGGMTFEAGQWHCFGTEMLLRIAKNPGIITKSTTFLDTTDINHRRPDLMFKPDYTVLIKEDCTYLEISLSDYINAYKSTQMQREHKEPSSSSEDPKEPLVRQSSDSKELISSGHQRISSRRLSKPSPR